jgi:hypothetical protein
MFRKSGTSEAKKADRRPFIWSFNADRRNFLTKSGLALVLGINYVLNPISSSFIVVKKFKIKNVPFCTEFKPGNYATTYSSYQSLH